MKRGARGSPELGDILPFPLGRLGNGILTPIGGSCGGVSRGRSEKTLMMKSRGLGLDGECHVSFRAY